jgi:hypothetical protein
MFQVGFKEDSTKSMPKTRSLPMARSNCRNEGWQAQRTIGKSLQLGDSPNPECFFADDSQRSERGFRRSLELQYGSNYLKTFLREHSTIRRAAICHQTQRQTDLNPGTD